MVNRMRKVTKIEANINSFTHLPEVRFRKKRVAAYARVSTDSAEQLTSYAAQVDHYKQYILSNPDWEFVKVYADEGISGLATKHRDGFAEMIEDAKSGKIDLILTKSVSRFARNTVDSLVNIRLLKDYGVEVYFEKENIWSFDGKGEVMLTIMASLAQEESRSISENVTWGHKKRFADGKYSLGYSRFLGYDKGPNGEFKINKEQAKVVRLIYRLTIDGLAAAPIRKILIKNSIKTCTGNDNWYDSTILSVLRNEKYKGDALLQKTFTVDYLSKTVKKNEGELPKYYLSGCHEAIINPVDWEIVQGILDERSNIGKGYTSKSDFSSKLICEKCGWYYGPKIFHSNEKYRKTVYQCNKKYSGKKICDYPFVTEKEVKDKFNLSYEQYIGDRSRIIEDAQLMASIVITDDNQAQIKGYINDIRTRTSMIEGWNSRIWKAVIHHVIVHKDKSMTFVFKDDTEITIE